jgi:signal transduction histidine kinase
MAMDNLISNASKYSHPKTTIRIELEMVGKNAQISVSDKGVGIHQDDMHRLFQKFSRIDNELSVEAGGNGIGLYLCREIVAMHGGKISVESEPGRGSSFVVELPKK